MKKKNESILVFTYKSSDTLLKFAGSQSWVLDAKRGKRSDYLVCVRNCNHQMSEEKEGHGEGFLVGKISNIIPAYSYPDRWLIEFDEYAEIQVPNLWKGWRNPVVYVPTSELAIDFDALEFKKCPKRNETFIEEFMENENAILGVSNFGGKRSIGKSKNNGLSIKEAKEGLAINYDVLPENIEIIIKG